jgi:hypothetical protein
MVVRSQYSQRKAIEWRRKEFWRYSRWQHSANATTRWMKPERYKFLASLISRTTNDLYWWSSYHKSGNTTTRARTRPLRTLASPLVRLWWPSLSDWRNNPDREYLEMTMFRNYGVRRQDFSFHHHLPQRCYHRESSYKNLDTLNMFCHFIPLLKVL